jgi:hypothetical protein
MWELEISCRLSFLLLGELARQRPVVDDVKEAEECTLFETVTTQRPVKTWRITVTYIYRLQASNKPNYQSKPRV